MTGCIDFLPDPCHDGLVLTNVAALAFDGVTPFELGLLCEAFGMDRTDDGVPLLDFAVCGPTVGTFRTTSGFGVAVEHDLTRVAERYPRFVYLAPNYAMDARIALTREGKILVLDQYDAEKIHRFIDG